jgi:hypothetical protein
MMKDNGNPTELDPAVVGLVKDFLVQLDSEINS